MDRDNSMYQAEMFPVVTHMLKSKGVESTTQKHYSLPQSDNLETQKSISRQSSAKSLSNASVNFPAIPPRQAASELPANDDDSWYFVHSPREEFGAEGPYGLEELRKFRKIGTIKDSTLMWQNGLKLWMPLVALPLLKNSLVKLPPIPSRHADRALNDPIAEPPTREEVIAVEKLAPMAKFSASYFCSRCGNTAVGHIPQTGEQNPDLTLLRQRVGSYKNASEILPGLLWIGNASTGRSKFFIDLGADIIINCTDNLKTPDSKPPHYRCKTVPLKEVKKPKDGDAINSAKPVLMDIDEVIGLFDKCFDYIENARLRPEREKEGDLVPPDYRGPVDRYGRPLRSKEEAALYNAKKRLPTDEDAREMRILLWSRLGFDRPCACVAAYLIRKWGMTVQSAVDFVTEFREGTIISDHHMSALEKYSERHTLGDLLCDDCLLAQSIPMKKNDGNLLGEVEAWRISEAANSGQETVRQRIVSSCETASCRSKMGVDVCRYFYFHRHFRECHFLIDVRITGLHMGDDDICSIVDVFESAQILHHLQLIDFSDNICGCAGVTSLCDALVRTPVCELSTLKLRNNRVGVKGGEALTSLLHPNFFISTLDLCNNCLGDDGAQFIAQALIIPEKDLFGDDDVINPDAAENASMYSQNTQEQSVAKSQPELDDDEALIKNCTITYLDLSNNDIGSETLQALSFVLKSSQTLINLKIDCAFGAKGNDISHLFTNCRVFNKTLRRISLADTRLAVNNFDNAMRIYQGGSIIEHINFSRCDLKAVHMKRSISKISLSRYLTHLDLSGNPITDDGASFLVSAISGTVDKYGNTNPPLKHLDISCCNITMVSAIKIVNVAETMHCLQSLDFADNNFSSGEWKDFASSLRSTQLVRLNLSRCRLGTACVGHILEALADCTPGNCGHTMKVLLLSQNDVHDSIDASLCKFLSNNRILEVLDLGFNKISDAGVLQSKEALVVKSSSPLESKLTELHVNMIGNRCNQHALELPGKARSKFTMRYGKEMYDSTMQHISVHAASDYLQRRKANAKLNVENSMSRIDFIE